MMCGGADLCGCLVVVAVFFSHFIQYGAVYGIGIYYILIAETYSAGATEVSLLCSIFTATFFASGLFSAVLTNKFDCRIVHMVGGIIGSTGFIISSFIHEIIYLYVTFGIVAGLGLGLCGPPSIVIVSQYFKGKSRALAFGIGLSGVGLGAFVFPQVVSLLVHHYHLRGSMLLTGALCLHLTLCGAVFIPKRDNINPEKTVNSMKASMKNLDLLQLTLLKDPSFLMLSMSCFLAGFGQSIVYVHIAAYAINMGLSKDEAANVISTTGMLNCIGRLIFGILPMIKQCGKFFPYITGLVLSGVFLSTVSWMHTYLALLIMVGSFGFLFAGFGALEPQVALEIVGEQRLASAFGYLQVFVASGSLLGAPIAGWLFEMTASYSFSFYLGGGAIVAAGMAAILPWFRMSCTPAVEAGGLEETEKIKPVDI